MPPHHGVEDVVAEARVLGKAPVVPAHEMLEVLDIGDAVRAMGVRVAEALGEEGGERIPHVLLAVVLVERGLASRGHRELDGEEG